MGTIFKETKIGRIPEEWEVVELNALIDEKRKITYGIVQPGQYDADGILLVRGKDYISGWAELDDLFRVSPKVETPYRRARLKCGDLIMSIAGDVGSVAIVPDWLEGANITQTTARLAIDSNKASNLFCYYFFQSEVGRKVIRKYVKGSAQQGLNLADVERFRISYPPLPEQRKIAEILSTVDEAIEKTDAIIWETQQLKKWLMQKLFTEGIRHSRFKETKIGQIPEEWDYEILGNVAEVKGGKRLPKGGQFAGTRTPYPYIRIVDFRNMSVAMGELKYLNEKTQKSIARYTISSSDVYISIAGTIGLVGIVSDELDGANLTENAAKICNLKKVNKVFLAYFLISPTAQKQIDSFIGISTQPKLALNRIEKIQLPIPDLDEQCKIAEILSEVDAKIETEQAFRAELERLKKGLMQVLLTGKVRVKV